MAPALQRAWLRRGALAWLLWPLSLVFGALAGAAARGLPQRPARERAHGGAGRGRGQRRRRRLRQDAGGDGAGRAPACARPCRRAWCRAAMGAALSDCREVRPDSRAGEVGDEPLLVAQRCEVPVFVAASRVPRRRGRCWRPIRQRRSSSATTGCSTIACSATSRSACSTSAASGNGWLLPAGPLREPWPRSVDLVLRTGAADGHRRLRSAAPAGSRWPVRGDGTRIELAALRGRAPEGHRRHRQAGGFLRDVAGAGPAAGADRRAAGPPRLRQ